jgi:hypothetical protein
MSGTFVHRSGLGRHRKSPEGGTTNADKHRPKHEQSQESLKIECQNDNLSYLIFKLNDHLKP